VRRHAALAAAVLFMFTWFERAIPDIHDGDASASTQVTSATTTPGAPQTPASHSVHLDHCTHSHAATTVLVRNLPSAVTGHATRPTSTSDALVTVVLDPDVRPPIA
jgi:hypothetical protein